MIASIVIITSIIIGHTGVICDRSLAAVPLALRAAPLRAMPMGKLCQSKTGVPGWINKPMDKSVAKCVRIKIYLYAQWTSYRTLNKLAQSKFNKLPRTFKDSPLKNAHRFMYTC